MTIYRSINATASAHHVTPTWETRVQVAQEASRLDNLLGTEFTAEAVRDWLGRLGVGTLFIEPGSIA